MNCEVDTELHTKRIKFGNEGLWVLSHYKLTKENWIEVYSQGEGRSENKLLKPIKEKSIETNEVLKIPVQQAHRFYNIIKTLRILGGQNILIYYVSMFY